MSANDTQIAGDHYQTSYQHWDFTYRFGYDTYQYIISKYIVRWKLKNGLEDLKKARHAMDKYFEVIAKRREDCIALPIKPKHDDLDVIKFCYANDLDTYQASIVSHLTGWEYCQDKDFLGSASKILDTYIAVVEKEQVPARYLDEGILQNMKERDEETFRKSFAEKVLAAEEAQCSPPIDLGAEGEEMHVSGVPYKVPAGSLVGHSLSDEEIAEQELQGKVHAREAQ